MVKIKFESWRSYIPLFLGFVLVASLCSTQLMVFINKETQIRTEQKAGLDLRKILLVSYGMWQESGKLDLDKLWQRLGRKEAFKDPWGTPFQVNFNERELQCLSAGPDREYFTYDDLEQTLPRVIAESFNQVPSTEEEPQETDTNSTVRAAQ